MLDLLSFDIDSLRKIGQGSSRTVLELGPDAVLKLSREGSDFGSDPNRWEVENWLRAEDEGWSELLCPILGWADDYSWLIMARATPLRFGDEPNTSCEEWLGMCSFLEWQGIEDLHPANFGSFEGRAVALDYAT